MLVSIAVMPAAPAVKVGTALQFTATGTYGDGTMKNLTDTAAWTSSNATIAGVNQSGLAVGKASGTATITATSGTIAGSTTLTVVTKADR
jgi:uncharacterized protein YjdB